MFAAFIPYPFTLGLAVSSLAVAVLWFALAKFVRIPHRLQLVFLGYVAVVALVVAVNIVLDAVENLRG